MFLRSSWESYWPEHQVVCIADPAMQMDQRLDGAWYMHPKHDILPAISGLISDLAAENQILHRKIVFHGSSLGGFGAIGAAAYLPNSRAVAEIPQIEFTNWNQNSTQKVEQYITGPIEEHRKKFPEQVSVQARLEKAGYIPPIRLITNMKDNAIQEHQKFFEWASTSTLPKGNHPLELLITTGIDGHHALKPWLSVPLIQP